jgi:hypothetical protein
MAKHWAEKTISEKLDCLREQLGEIIDELHARPDDVAQSQKKSIQVSIVRH